MIDEPCRDINCGTSHLVGQPKPTLDLSSENAQLKKALLEMKEVAETWKALVEAMERVRRQRGTKEDYVTIQTYYEATNEKTKSL